MCLSERLLYAAGKSDMVFLEQYGIVQPAPVICPVAHPDGVFFQQAKPRRGFARVADTRICPRQPFDELVSQRRYTAQVREEIQRGSFAGQDRARGSVQMEKVVAFGHEVPVL